MQVQVELQVVARFGKRDGASDYSWLVGRENVPPELLNVCEPLARVSGNAGTYIGLVAEAGSKKYLVRAFRQGVDNAYRVIAAVEVALIISPQPLPLEHWLGLAVVSIQKTERERIGEATQFTIHVPQPQVEPMPPDSAQLVRARLGLPVTTSIRSALSLLNLRPWVYRGVCFASIGKGDQPLEWLDVLAPYVCVNFAEPRVSDIENALVEAAQARPISEAEWEVLRTLPLERTREALQWATRPVAPSAVNSSEDPLLAWLVIFRSSHLKGARLLATLRHDIKPHTLPLVIVNEVTRDLSTEAAAFIATLTRNETTEASPAIIEELGRQGYLADEEAVPLRIWVKYARHSESLTQQARLRFSEQNIDPAAAEFVLDLDTTAHPEALNSDSLKTAARLAVAYGLPIPRLRLRKVLETVHQPEQLQLFDELGDIYGGWANALARLLLDGTAPPEGMLTAEEMSAAVNARVRALNMPDASLELLSALIKSERREEAGLLLQMSMKSHAWGLSEEASKVLQARLDLLPPVPPPPLNELKLLAQFELATPSDIALGESDVPHLADYAKIWPVTGELAAVLEADGHQFQDTPRFPDTWTKAVRSALSPSRAARWLKHLDSPQRHLALRWLGDIHDFDPNVLEAVCGEAIAEGAIWKNIMPWISASVAWTTRRERLRGLANVAGAHIARRNDLLAGNIVRSLFPEMDAESHAFAMYALSGVGPFPVVTGVSPDLIVALTPWLDPGALVDAVFASIDPTISMGRGVATALADQVREKGVPYPSHGYTAEQRQRHLPLAATLSCVTGWEALAPEIPERVNYAMELLHELGLRPQDLQAGQLIETHPEPFGLSKIAEEEG